MDPQEVQEVVQQLGNEYRGNAYHLLERNCNHFSDELAFKLTGNHAPPWVRTHSSYPASYLDQVDRVLQASISNKKASSEGFVPGNVH